MSRANKFRVWDKKYECYVKVESIDFDFHGNIDSVWVDCEEHHHDHAVLNTDEVILEQYTGLKDKDGKEIYEGDIVSCYSLSGEYGALFVVKYGELPDICGHEYCPCLQGFYLDEIDEYEEVDEDGYMEVIGNIHENPELLGGGE